MLSHISDFCDAARYVRRQADNRSSCFCGAATLSNHCLTKAPSKQQRRA